MIVRDGKVISVNGEEVSINAQTICIHSDAENSVAIVEEIRNALIKVGFGILSISPQSSQRTTEL